jgi:hypothetical protein
LDAGRESCTGSAFSFERPIGSHGLPPLKGTSIEAPGRSLSASMFTLARVGARTLAPEKLSTAVVSASMVFGLREFGFQNQITLFKK